MGPRRSRQSSRRSATGCRPGRSQTPLPRTSSEVVADLVTPERVVKAANTLGAPVLASDPDQAGGQRVLFLSGDDGEANADSRGLFEDAGFSVIDLGGLRDGGKMQQFGAPLAGHNLIRLP